MLFSRRVLRAAAVVILLTAGCSTTARQATDEKRSPACEEKIVAGDRDECGEKSATDSSSTRAKEILKEVVGGVIQGSGLGLAILLVIMPFMIGKAAIERIREVAQPPQITPVPKGESGALADP
jgi:hypothetical protein